MTRHEKDTVHLAWNPPEHDGGAPIRRYIIEGKCEDDADFRHIGKVDGKTTNWDSIGLQKGKHYQFRVRAENPVGTSDDTADLDEVIYTGPATGMNCLKLDSFPWILSHVNIVYSRTGIGHYYVTVSTTRN